VTAKPARGAADQLDFLDGLRGLAALWVLLHHARWLLWEGYEAYQQHAASYSAWDRALVYILAPLRDGHAAVLFFFVLSGFVIHYGYAKKLAAYHAWMNRPKTPECTEWASHQLPAGEVNFGWWGYFKRRARRLYPPLLLALVLTFALDSFGTTLGWAIYRHETPYGLINSEIHSDRGLNTALGNLAFLMRGWVDCFGTNGPLWSLHFEWWFYMIYPLLWLFVRRSLGVPTAVVGLAFVLSFLVPPGPFHALAQIFSALLTWWFGALMAEIFVGRIKVRWSWIAPLSLLLPALMVLMPRLKLHWPGLAGWGGDTLYGLGFAGLLALCFLLRERGWHLRLLERLQPLGAMSYTLYIIHLPLLVFMSGWLIARSPDWRTGGTLPPHFVWFFAGSAVCLFIAWCAHFFVERPFIRKKCTA
jgi:peptidoglycan/LPS O-acetylase OafA/YrhL